MMLFSDIDRFDERPKRNIEPEYSYLDASARPEAACIRATLSEWFDHYPAEHATELLSRFRSLIDSQHLATALELYTHEVLIRLGYQVTVHPDTGIKGTRPDFLAQGNGGTCTYIEAVRVSDKSRGEEAADSLVRAVFDYINGLKISDFFVSARHTGVPKTAPPAKRMLRQITEWLHTLDVNRIVAEVGDDNFDRLPQLELEHEGWQLILSAIPRKAERRADPVDRLIGAEMPEAQWLNTRQVLLDSLVKKASKYGALNAPLVLMVGADVMHLDRTDAVEALFGQEEYVFQAGHSEPTMRRATNGFWHGPAGRPRYTRVSGVILVDNLKPWTFAVRNPVLYLNPRAAHPVEGAFLNLPCARVVEGKMIWSAGLRPRHLLNMPSCYPGMEFDV